MESITEKAYNESKTINNGPKYINTTDNSKNPTLTSIDDLASVVAGIMGVVTRTSFNLEPNESRDINIGLSYSLIKIGNSQSGRTALFMLNQTGYESLVPVFNNNATGISSTDSSAKLYVVWKTSSSINVTNNYGLRVNVNLFAF